ncbi:hypothetical protein Asp14428_08500 [Actinoplanes sp. NBRC 14428]|uniref:TPP-dependent pyruvate/acetoin dehydrogenase alpha subunit n=1 Tax=Pseudosporangium ferrugineum TaxID=439699 RepID=A0A2T0SG39_9ACTN|nr:hypothetical protein [Pseudosporangium ferrugineum]PRY32376.1 TPP-dependent pyruvate/acetoin dehydrogenase alpha subunit [Pseudosporangium ferrugineum]BCJ49375.1 hypothetical protein Asp14428_08500 [Actinoplanes sp. NBRC 14428]
MGRTSSAHAAPAARRTQLLHRMLLVRRLEEQLALAAATPAPEAGDEAVAVGLLTALAPGDALIAAGPHGPWHALVAAAALFGGDVTTAAGPDQAVARARDTARDGDHRVVAVCLPGAAPAGGDLGGVPLLFCHRGHLAAAGTAATVLSVDGDDVEAVTGAAGAEAGVLRAGAGPCLLGLRSPGPGHDPIARLAGRMRTDHQLDDNTLRAIDRDATARAAAFVRNRPPAGS